MPTHSAPTPVLTEKKKKKKTNNLYGKKTKQNYCAVLTLVISKNKITIATNSIDECIDRALQEFTGSIFEVSRCMCKKCELGKSYKGGSAWF